VDASRIASVESSVCTESALANMEREVSNEPRSVPAKLKRGINSKLLADSIISRMTKKPSSKLKSSMDNKIVIPDGSSENDDVMQKIFPKYEVAPRA